MELQWLTVKDVAQELKIGTRRVQVLLQEGRIEGARRMGRMWLIPKGYKVKRTEVLGRNVTAYDP